MIGIVIILFLLVGVRFTVDMDFGCWFIGAYISLFSVFILIQLYNLKKGINQFACPACVDGSWCKKICTGSLFFLPVGICLSVIMSISLVSFLVTINLHFIMYMIVDAVLFYMIINKINNNNYADITLKANAVVKEIVGNFFNILILTAFFVFVELYDAKDIPMDFVGICNGVEQTIHNSCGLFQDLLRTQEALQRVIFATKNINGIGEYLFPILYLSSLSLLPLTAITLLYRFGVNNGNVFGFYIKTKNMVDKFIDG